MITATKPIEQPKPPVLKIDDRLRDILPALAATECNALYESLAADGCLHDIIIGVIDGEQVIVDGHHRYLYCRDQGIPFKTRVKPFDSLAAAIEWMINFQDSRRNWTSEQEKYARGRLAEERKKAPHRPAANNGATDDTVIPAGRTRDIIAAKEGVSPRTVARNARYANAIDAIGKKCPTAKTDILAHKIKATDAQVEQLAALPKPSLMKVVANVYDGNTVKDALTKVPTKSRPKLRISAGTAFDPTELDAAKGRKRKNGAEVSGSALKRDALKVFGQLLRLLDKLDLHDECRADLDRVLATIKKA